MVEHLSPLAALLATSLLIVLLRPIARVAGLVDVPNERKSHAEPTPLVGGLAIFIALALTCEFVLPPAAGLPVRQALSFFGASTLLVAVGVVDDFLELSPLVRFVAQIVATLVMIYGGGVVLNDLGTMMPGGGLLDLGVLSVPFTVFATIGVINALNMCDGLDGLSGSLSLVSLAGLLVASALWGGGGNMAMLTLLGACIVGFLLFNLRLPGRKRASIFMGDAGSMFLGFALTWFAISLSQGEVRVIRPSAALWFLMVPIFDAVSMMFRRLLQGRSPFAPDREHLHHVFLLAGYSVNQTVGMLSLLAAFGVLVGLASIQWQVPEIIVSGGFLACGLCYFWLIMHAWRVMRLLHRSICRRRIAADRRRGPDPAYQGPERRLGADRRAVPVASPGEPKDVRAPGSLAASRPVSTGN